MKKSANCKTMNAIRNLSSKDYFERFDASDYLLENGARVEPSVITEALQYAASFCEETLRISVIEIAVKYEVKCLDFLFQFLNDKSFLVRAYALLSIIELGKSDDFKKFEILGYSPDSDHERIAWNEYQIRIKKEIRYVDDIKAFLGRDDHLSRSFAQSSLDRIEGRW